MYDDDSQREKSRPTEVKLLNHKRLIYCNLQSTDLMIGLAVSQKRNGLCIHTCIRRVIYENNIFDEYYKRNIL